jgi:hypothetical protein
MPKAIITIRTFVPTAGRADLQPQSMSLVYAESAARFAAETKDHVLTVMHDDGLYRHLRFTRPRTGMYRFDLVTWPGHLSFGGDMDGYVFARDPDMFEFFRDSRYGINPGYWHEKVVAGTDRVKVYSEDRFRQLVVEHFTDAVRYGNAPRGLGKAVREEILNDDYGELGYEEGARDVLNRFEYRRGKERFSFTDTYEWELRDFNWSYLWACHAIQWGIAQYDAAKAAAPVGELIVI